jgi:membrane protein DedA with SNARE-associated domain
MEFEPLMVSYGLPLVALGAGLEGEAAVLAAAFLAHRGYLTLSGVIIASTIGTIISAQGLFHLGRWRGLRLLEKRPRWMPLVHRVRHLLHDYHLPVVLVYRFIFGLRTITPIVLGITHLSTPRFIGLNILGGAIWAAIIACVGYFFGHLVELLIHDLKKHEWSIALGIVLLGLVVALVWHFHLRPRKAAREDADEADPLLGEMPGVRSSDGHQLRQPAPAPGPDALQRPERAGDQ